MHLSLQVVPELLVSSDALLELLPEKLHRCQLQLQSMETLGAANRMRCSVESFHLHQLQLFLAHSDHYPYLSCSFTVLTRLE